MSSDAKSALEVLYKSCSWQTRHGIWWRREVEWHLVFPDWADRCDTMFAAKSTVNGHVDAATAWWCPLAPWRHGLDDAGNSLGENATMRLLHHDGHARHCPTKTAVQPRLRTRASRRSRLPIRVLPIRVLSVLSCPPVLSGWRLPASSYSSRQPRAIAFTPSHQHTLAARHSRPGLLPPQPSTPPFVATSAGPSSRQPPPCPSLQLPRPRFPTPTRALLAPHKNADTQPP